MEDKLETFYENFHNNRVLVQTIVNPDEAVKEVNKIASRIREFNDPKEYTYGTNMLDYVLNWSLMNPYFQDYTVDNATAEILARIKV